MKKVIELWKFSSDESLKGQRSKKEWWLVTFRLWRCFFLLKETRHFPNFAALAEHHPALQYVQMKAWPLSLTSNVGESMYIYTCIIVFSVRISHQQCGRGGVQWLARSVRWTSVSGVQDRHSGRPEAWLDLEEWFVENWERKKLRGSGFFRQAELNSINESRRARKIR